MAAESVTSVLLIDFDGVRRSLNAIDVEAGDQLAASAGRWLEALENGDLISPSGPRRILLRRCFADPDMLGDGSKAMADSGFDVIDSPARKGGHSGAELHFAIDAVDALNDNVDYAEFILLSPDANLTPLLARLKGADRKTVVYSDDELTVKQRRLADAVLTSEALAAFITGSDSRARAPDRAKIEAFARKISSVTSIPLLTPKTYAELFRQLSVEITTNGYDFQTTARRVADRLSAIGRNVARRQVVFVVKGLALKGHVFSNDDTPRRLAEVFREQARYLIGNTGTPLDAGEERLLSAWLVDRTRKRVTGGKATTKAKVATTPKAAASKADSNAETPQPKKAKRSRKQKAEAEAGLPDKPAEGDLTGPIIDDQPRRTMRTAAQVKAEIAARIASSVRDRKTAAAMSVDGKPPPKSKKPTREDAVAGQPNAQKSASEDGGDSGEAGANEQLENSILAAIAEAVDVLVEGADGVTATDETAPAETSREKEATPTTPPSPEPSEDSEGERHRRRDPADHRLLRPRQPARARLEPFQPTRSHSDGAILHQFLRKAPRPYPDTLIRTFT